MLHIVEEGVQAMTTIQNCVVIFIWIFFKLFHTTFFISCIFIHHVKYLYKRLKCQKMTAIIQYKILPCKFLIFTHLKLDIPIQIFDIFELSNLRYSRFCLPIIKGIVRYIKIKLFRRMKDNSWADMAKILKSGALIAL